MWQPIETAPDEGLFLVFGHWPENGDVFYQGKPWWQFGHGHRLLGPFGDWDDQCAPTHWMPLPEPPKVL